LSQDHRDYTELKAFGFNPGNPEVIPRLTRKFFLPQDYWDYSGFKGCWSTKVITSGL
jgi:hypothetical protein